MARMPSARAFPKLNSCVMKQLSETISRLRLVPSLPDVARRPMNRFLEKAYPSLPADIQELLKQQEFFQPASSRPHNDSQPCFSSAATASSRAISSDIISTAENEIFSSFLSTPPSMCKQAAVLLPLCCQNNVPSILFTIRSQFVKTHKGHVSFPGGHINPGETAVRAALRETVEELGDGIGEIEILGYCSPLFAITETLVFPVIGFVKTDVGSFQNLTPSLQEVDQVFCLPIDHLLNPQNREEILEERFGVKLLLPSFKGGPAKFRIWGLTGLILNGILVHVLSEVIQ